jgi:hypothetical protein
MPLDGFRVLEWASLTFGASSPVMLGAMALVVLIVAVVLGAMGVKMVPMSSGLLVASVSLLVLSYFIVGAAVSGASSSLPGSEDVAGMAPRIVPWAAGLTPIGLAMFGLRAALRSWSSEEGTGKVAGLLFAVLSLGGWFVGVQVIRGSASLPALSATADAEAPPPSTEPDGPVRRRGVTAPRR